MSEIILPELQIDSVYWHNYNAMAEQEFKNAMKLAYSRFPESMKKIARFAIQDVAMRKIASINATNYEMVDDSDVMEFFDNEFMQKQADVIDSNYDYSTVDYTPVDYKVDTAQEAQSYKDTYKGESPLDEKGVNTAAEGWGKFMNEGGMGNKLVRNAFGASNALIDMNVKNLTKNWVEKQKDSFVPFKIAWTRFIKGLYGGKEGWQKWVPESWGKLSQDYEDYVTGYGNSVRNAMQQAMRDEGFRRGFAEAKDPYAYMVQHKSFADALNTDRDFIDRYGSQGFNLDRDNIQSHWYSPTSWMGGAASRKAKSMIADSVRQGGDIYNRLRDMYYQNPLVQDQLYNKGWMPAVGFKGIIDAYNKGLIPASVVNKYINSQNES